MLRIFILAIGVFVSSAHADGPIVVSNGGGIAEYNVIYAQRSMPEWIALCISQKACSAGVEPGLARLVVTDFASTELTFLTATEMGEALFRISGQDKVELNKDKLFTSLNGDVKPWDISAAAAFWVTLADQRSPEGIPEALEIADRLARLAGTQVSRTQNPDADFRDIGAVLFRLPFSTLVIDNTRVGTEAMAVEIPFHGLSCAATSGVAQPIENLRIVDVHWMSTQGLGTNHPRMTVAGVLEYTCPDGTNSARRFYSNYLVHIGTARDGDRIILNTGSVEIIQDRIRLKL